MAGQISELARDTLPSDYRMMNTGDGRILLVEGGDRVLAAFPPDLSESAVRQLEGLGVTSLVNELVVDIDAAGVELKAPDGSTRRVGARTVIWAAGVAAASIAGRLAEAAGAETDRAGRITVEPDLTLPGHPEVMALGDMVRVKSADGERAGPARASRRWRCSRAATPRPSSSAGSPASRSSRSATSTRATSPRSGRARAVAEIKGLHFGGPLAWLLWLGIHIFYLIGFQNRILVLTRWSFSFLTRGRGARLITGESATGSPVGVSTPQD